MGSRISQRVSAVWSAVKCPGCGARVDPKDLHDLVPKDLSPPTTGGDLTRWSFLWLAPRGDFCPHCDFPLSKYFGRLKWIRTLVVGVAIVLLGIGGEIVGHIGRLGTTYFWIMRNAVRLGALVAAVGFTGVIIGGRRAGRAARAHRASQRETTRPPTQPSPGGADPRD